MIKYDQFINESLTFNEEVDEDRVTISGYINNLYIGKVTIEYVMSGYWEFESEMTEDEYYEIFPDDRFAKIEYISIDSDHTGNGYAKELMYKAIDSIKSRGENTIYLNASPMGHRGMNINGLVSFFGFEIFIDDYDHNKEMVLKV